MCKPLRGKLDSQSVIDKYMNESMNECFRGWQKLSILARFIGFQQESGRILPHAWTRLHQPECSHSSGEANEGRDLERQAAESEFLSSFIQASSQRGVFWI